MRKVNLVYLAAYLFVTLILYIPPIAGTNLWNWNLYVCICGAGAFSYSYFVVSRHRRTGFWKGFGTILLICVIAQVVEDVVYAIALIRTPYIDIVALYFAGIILVASLAAVIVCYPIGYAAFWSRYRRTRV
jgi:hypothetical protein